MVKFKQGVVSKYQLSVKLTDINSVSLIRLFKRYDVIKIQKAFTNRYDSNGKLKPEQTEFNENELESWNELKMKNVSKAFKFVSKLRKQKEIITALVEYPIQLNPEISPNDPQFTANSQ